MKMIQKPPGLKCNLQKRFNMGAAASEDTITGGWCKNE